MAKQRILIIEDDQALAPLISDHLMSEGFETDTAADGEGGLAAAEKKPDLILLDILLPKMNGFAVMKAIREKDAWGASVPVIIFSNLSPDDERAVANVAAYAPAFYLVKSEHSLSDLVRKIREVLSSGSQ